MNKESNPLLSVIIPVYNTALFLEEAIQSILAQDFADYEIIVINDGSTDGSAEILEKFREEDERIQVYHQANAGLSATRNVGLLQASGTYIYFFDSDDKLCTGALKRIIQSIDKTGSQIVAFSGCTIDEQSEIIQIETEDSYLKPDQREPMKGEDLFVEMDRSGKYSPIVSMYLYRRRFLEKNSLSFLEGFIHEDEHFTIQALCTAEKTISIADICYEYRVRSGSIMAEKYSLKNLEGWAKAVSQMIVFLTNQHLENETKKRILKRAEKLAHNCVKIIHMLNKDESTKLQIEDYLGKKELDKLGFEVIFRYKFPTLFKVYNRF